MISEALAKLQRARRWFLLRISGLLDSQLLELKKRINKYANSTAISSIHQYLAVNQKRLPIGAWREATPERQMQKSLSLILMQALCSIIFLNCWA